MFNTIKRIYKTAWQGIVRNKWLSFACIAMMVISLLIFSSVLIFFNTANKMITILKDKADISLYFKRDIPSEDILRIRDELIGRPEIAKIEYVSQEAALKNFQEKSQKNPTIQKALEGLGENPLSAHLNIKAKNPSDYQKIIEYANNSPFKDKLITVDLSENQKVIEKINLLAQGIKLGSVLLIFVLTALSVIITFNTIRMAIYSLKEEIEIMKLVGASSWFIRGPFIMEGIIQGLIASLAATLVFMPLIFWLDPKIEYMVSGLGIGLYFWSHFWYIFLYQTVFSLITAAISSFLAINKYLKV
ncbi:MAG: permease-like cell division protein FtsX [Candidatus Paceibacterota bacterium]|jgi:cell division transport system permease protein|nr:permease-like cell division protein FtsX [Candidatus Paceibacterota bacterium]MDD3548821.1 permease-like cell division protein FtsX [Candidatus Paceibacterota bacterium]MDD4999333.1 permease-like cell division protein FtsX [Candidatus Paceibacterota bacterium]MDD5545476.1 permease-like cell division protein FtsX [Candidatus Paceibacterota bacterium]